MICEQNPAKTYKNKVMNFNTAETVRELLKRTEKKRVSVVSENA